MRFAIEIVENITCCECCHPNPLIRRGILISPGRIPEDKPSPCLEEQGPSALLLRFFEDLFGCDGTADEIEVRAISARGRVWSEWFRNPEELMGWVQEGSHIPGGDGSESICLGVARRQGRDRTDGGVREIRAAWADLDAKRETKLIEEHGLSNAVRILEIRIRSYDIPPTWLIDSGGGVHPYWCLLQPVDPLRVRKLNRAIAQTLAPAADPTVVNPSRVMRMPGSRNRKPQYQEFYGTAPICTIISYSGRYYSIEELESAFPSAQPRSIYEPKRPPGPNARRSLVPCAQRLIDAWPTQAGSRHQAALVVATACLRAGISQTEAEALVQEAANASGDEEIPDRLRAVTDTYRTGQTRSFECECGGIIPGICDRVRCPVGRARAQGHNSRAQASALGASDCGPEHGGCDHTPPWPDPLEQAAFHGLAGEIVRAIEPHTEADPAALLFQLLVGFGSAVGGSPFFPVEATLHRVNLFVVLVGVTSKGRKGTSLDRVLNLLEAATPPQSDEEEGAIPSRGWIERVQEGLSSGEGLIWAVRDAITKIVPEKQGGQIVGYNNVITDPGVSDKRLLVAETEFSSVLKLATREGNTLSATLRRAWDRGDLRILNKNSPATATNAHVSIIGHITRDDLLRHLAETEAANGFGNRFIWAAVRRSKCLPEGGNLSTDDLAPLVQRLREAIEFARTVGEMHRDDEARALWWDVYPVLSEGKPGLFGAITSRAEAQVTRLSCVYALLDLSAVIRREHLEAALAVWKYVEASARWIFGESLGDPTADTLLKALRDAPDGLSRTAIRDLFDRNKPRAEIDRALDLLSSLGLIRKTIEPSSEAGGRSTEIWRAV